MTPDNNSTELTPAQAFSTFGIATHNFETAITAYEPAQQEIIRWWFFLAKERGWALAKLADATGVSATTLSRVFRGVYKAEIVNVTASLTKAKDIFAEVSDNPEFIRTALAARMFAAFDKCRALGNVTICWGEMGIGKTTIIEEYRRLNNHGKTQVVRFPAGATFAYFVAHVGKSLGVAAGQSGQFATREKILTIMAAGKRLLIIDELHQAFLTTRSDTAVKCCEFLREIADVSKCGIVLIGTEVLQREIFKGPHKDALRQLVDRGTVQLSLPAKATKGDVVQFLGFYGLKLPGERDPEARQILSDILTSSGLRKLTLHLRDGAAFAARKNEPFTWDHFTTAFEAIQSLNK
jgi:DNA transposition AAA+ family ATPase